MKKKAKFVGVIGHIEPNWVERQIRLENNIAFAKSEHYVPTAKPSKPQKKWEPTPHYVFGLNIQKLKGYMP